MEALTRLQDRVPAFDGDRAVELAEAALEKPILEVFESFDSTPLAAASLGQVHRATLYGGRQVAVKVQREGLKDIYDKDLGLLGTTRQGGEEGVSPPSHQPQHSSHIQGKMVGVLDRFNITVGGAGQSWTDLFDEATEILYR